MKHDEPSPAEMQQLQDQSNRSGREKKVQLIFLRRKHKGAQLKVVLVVGAGSTALEVRCDSDCDPLSQEEERSRSGAGDSGRGLQKHVPRILCNQMLVTFLNL